MQAVGIEKTKSPSVILELECGKDPAGKDFVAVALVKKDVCLATSQTLQVAYLRTVKINEVVFPKRRPHV